MSKKQLFTFWEFNGDNRSFCNQKCPYCHAKGTLILMGNLTWKPIEQLKIGEIVVGYNVVRSHWRSTLTKITNVFHRKANIVKMITDKQVTYCTPDHKWMLANRSYLPYIYRKTEKLIGHPIRFISNPVNPPIINADYKLGWLNGMLRGDGCVKGYPNNPKTKYYFRLAVKDHEILKRFKEYTNHNLNEYHFVNNLQAIQSQKKSVHFAMKKIMTSWLQTESFAKGFLAGIFDAEGSFSKGALRISNSDPQIISEIQKSFKMFNFHSVLEPNKKGKNNNVRTIRVTGGISEYIRFFALTNPSVSRKRKYIFGRTTHNPSIGNATRTNVLSTTDCDIAEVYNITTETGNYVANGLISKNCYGKDGKTYKHYWIGNVDRWEKAFERLNRDIYFVFSYGECMGAHGFYECVDMIGKHPNWTLNIITNLSYSPERLIASRLGKERRLFVTACWHPLGVDDRVKGWENFKRNLLMLKKAEIPVHVMMVWYRPQIKWFPEYFEWFDKNDFRIGVRRFVYDEKPFLQKLFRRAFPKWFAGKISLEDYTEAERGYIYAYTCPKVTKYGLDLASSYGVSCSAGKDMILVEYDGEVKLCACCYGKNHRLGNIFDENYRLNDHNIKCPTNSCGGDFGMLHLIDDEFGPLPERLWDDTFISQVENITQSSPVAYHRREEMLKWLEEIKKENVRS